jgi:hypothetical protein
MGPHQDPLFTVEGESGMPVPMGVFGDAPSPGAEQVSVYPSTEGTPAAVGEAARFSEAGVETMGFHHGIDTGQLGIGFLFENGRIRLEGDEE